MLGFVPWRRVLQWQIEFEGAWLSQTLETNRVHSVPLVGSLCWVYRNVRFCGGLATTVFVSNQTSENALRLQWGGSFRVGTELFVRGPFSLRADVFGRIAFSNLFGNTTMALDAPTPLAAGLAVMAAWSSD